MTNTKSFLSFFIVVAVAIFSRFIPHYPNMTAFGALAIYSGFAARPRWVGLGLVITTLFFTDWVLSFHNTMFYTYGAWILVFLLASFVLTRFTWGKLVGIGLVSAFMFFVISNFGVWMVGALYPKTFAGLIECYVAALPFFGNQVVGDVGFSLGLFALHFAINTALSANYFRKA